MEKSYKTKNGIDIYGYKNSSQNGFFISLFLRAGSMYESERDSGITHFLEHVSIRNVNKLYGGKPGDDATACVVRIRKREPMNMLFGPPSNRDDANRMMSLFFSKEGKHIICGGTTSSIAASCARSTVS